jgi:hypothetical protein
MVGEIIVETRMEDDDKWEANASFSDFETCRSHVEKLVRNDSRVVRLIVTGGLTAEQKSALAPLNVQFNS